jgi:hypothetical protein
VVSHSQNMIEQYFPDQTIHDEYPIFFRIINIDIFTSLGPHKALHGWERIADLEEMVFLCVIRVPSSKSFIML